MSTTAYKDTGKGKVYAIDIDGVLCHTIGNDYTNSTPDYDTIARVNELYQQGHYIEIFTARGSSSGIDWREFTENQLNSWGLWFHELILGKPSYDIIIDDKALCLSRFMGGDNKQCQ